MLHHLEIYVSNLNKTREFWDWFLTELGYEPFQKWESGVSWKHGSTYLVFVQADELTIEIKAKGMNLLYSDRYPYAGGQNHYALYFEDPDRIKVEVVAPTTEVE